MPSVKPVSHRIDAYTQELSPKARAAGDTVRRNVVEGAKVAGTSAKFLAKTALSFLTGVVKGK